MSPRINRRRIGVLLHWVLLYLPVAIPLLLVGCACYRCHPRQMAAGLLIEFSEAWNGGGYDE